MVVALHLHVHVHDSRSVGALRQVDNSTRIRYLSNIGPGQQYLDNGNLGTTPSRTLRSTVRPNLLARVHHDDSH